MSKIIFMLFVLVNHQVTPSFAAVTCIGSNNKPVDWFIIYKMPKVKNSTSDNTKEGTGIVYMDENQSQWRVLPEPISGFKQPVYYTLKQMYDVIGKQQETKDNVYLMYNDKAPDVNKSSSSKAHAKGSLYFDKKSGFWLIHSIPSFPHPKYYNYPESGRVFGQMLICVSFGTDNLEAIGKQLQTMNPQLFAHNITPYFQKVAPVMYEFLMKNKKNKLTDNVENIKSLAGRKFLSFSKARRFKKDLYQDLVANELKNNILVQTWLNGNGDIPSNCSSTYSVKNVLTMDVLGVKFKDSKDHSKWAISDPDDDSDIPKYNDDNDNEVPGDDDNDNKIPGDDDDNDVPDGDDNGGDNNQGGDDDNEIKDIKSAINRMKSLSLASKYFGLKRNQANKNRNINNKNIINNNNNNNNWICVGDINRQISQYKRGGGTLCFQNEPAWKEFKKMIIFIEECKNI